jgi:hypothetical protein
MHWKARRNGAWFLRRADVQQSLGQMQDRQTFISVHDGFRIRRLVKSPPQCLVNFPSVPGLSPGYPRVIPSPGYPQTGVICAPTSDF